ncbi:hypothetical protein WP3S18E03_P12010 (plasmid) [Klebsiella quasipneumoniae]|nr:hypothetical protein WP3S18E03_P12010 [Klebsiella quasipneumoniae]
MLGINRFRRDIQTQGNKGQAQLLNIRGVSLVLRHRKGARITSVSLPLSVRLKTVIIYALDNIGRKTEGQECPQTDKSHSDNAGGILSGTMFHMLFPR